MGQTEANRMNHNASNCKKNIIPRIHGPDSPDLEEQMTSITRRLLSLAVLVLILSNLLAAQDAASFYKSKCAACHGADGKGSAMGKKLGALDFASPEVQKMTDDQLAATINDGKGKDMPSYKKSLNPQQTKDLVGYVRSLGKK